MPKKKLAGTEIQSRFSDSEVCLNFWKRVGPLRNGKELLSQSLSLSLSFLLRSLVIRQ